MERLIIVKKRAGRIVYQHDGEQYDVQHCKSGDYRKGTGQVLIGTATEGHADADDLTLQAPSGYTGITLRSGTTTGGAIYFSDATSGTGELDGQIVYKPKFANHDVCDCWGHKINIKIGWTFSF